MTIPKIGSYIGILCTINEGPFEDEVLVEFEALEGTVSGFATRDMIRELEGQHFIRGRVLAVSGDTVTVMVEGSFFTTNGLATFSSDMLRPALQAA